MTFSIDFTDNSLRIFEGFFNLYLSAKALRAGAVCTALCDKIAAAVATGSVELNEAEVLAVRTAAYASRDTI